MALGVNPTRTILVRFGGHDEPSDIHGLDYILFDGSKESRERLKTRLGVVKCAVVVRSGDWLRAGEGGFAKALERTALRPPADERPSATDLAFVQPFYFAPGDSTPFCPRCWEASKRRIHLDDAWKRTRWECPDCHHTKVLEQALPLEHLEPRATRRSEPRITPEAWLNQEARFKNLRGHISGIWMRAEGSSQVTWTVAPMAGSTEDDLLAFRTEAMLARNLLVRADLLVPQSADAEDDWLNAVRSLTESKTDVMIAGTHDGHKEEGRVIENLERRSALACARLASGAKPTP
jgi:hypothetical protein